MNSMILSHILCWDFFFIFESISLISIFKSEAHYNIVFIVIDKLRDKPKRWLFEFFGSIEFLFFFFAKFDSEIFQINFESNLKDQMAFKLPKCYQIFSFFFLIIKMTIPSTWYIDFSLRLIVGLKMECSVNKIFDCTDWPGIGGRSS